MKLASRTIADLDVSYRPGTADETVLDLVLARNHYGFPGDMIGMMVVDIGAHIGSATMWCASHGATVFAYEPCHDNYVLCRRNISQNGLDARVYELAVGVPGTRTFFLNPANTASNGEHALAEGNTGNYEAVEAEWVSLQTVFDDNNIGFCHILKMDCEGDETDVIPQILGLHERIGTVVGEVHAGQWPQPTPDLDQRIHAAVSSLDRFYYTSAQISNCEYRWEHR